jgi:hypothetical protein
MAAIVAVPRSLPGAVAYGAGRGCACPTDGHPGDLGLNIAAIIAIPAATLIAIALHVRRPRYRSSPKGVWLHKYYNPVTRWRVGRQAAAAKFP